MRMLRALSALALFGAGAVLFAVVAAPASASCAGPPPAAGTVFTGTVTATSHKGRQATVRTSDGRTVTVNGSPDLNALATSVDRTYETGATYEFHVLNDTSPYEDNACTATKQISGGGSQVSTGTIAAGGAAVLAIAAVIVVLVRRRHADRTPGQPA